MKPLLCCVVILCAGLMAGCGFDSNSGSKRLSPAMVASIRNGVTTKLQVRGLLGAPQSVKTQLPVQQPPGTEPLPVKYLASEIWAFWSDKKQSKPFFALGAAKTSRYLVIIYFDAQGVVLDCQSEASQM